MPIFGQKNVNILSKLHCILGLKSQLDDFFSDFSQKYLLSYQYFVAKTSIC